MVIRFQVLRDKSARVNRKTLKNEGCWIQVFSEKSMKSLKMSEVLIQEED
jgi:hypothetical protein